MPRSINLLFVSRKPAIQGIFHVGGMQNSCIAGFFRALGHNRHLHLKENFEYPLRKNNRVNLIVPVERHNEVGNRFRIEIINSKL